MFRRPRRCDPSRSPGGDLRSERGSLLLEFALAIPILLALILGGVTTGLAYNTNNSLNNGARESARFAATLPTDDGMASWLNTVADVAVGSASGEMDATDPGQELCIAYVHPDGSSPDDSTASIVESGGGRVVSDGVTCFDDGRPDSERRVQVVLRRSAEINAVAYTRTLDLQAASVVRFERGG